MKTLKAIFNFLILVSILFFTSCEQNDPVQKSKLKFAIGSPVESLKSYEMNKDDSLNFNSWHILVSLEKSSGIQVLDDEIIPLINFGDGYITSSIELETGNYRLTKFMVITSSGQVIYAAPLEGSEKAQLIEKPLPLDFTVIPGETSTVRPEVLPVNNSLPADFGYVSFGFDVVDVIQSWVSVVNAYPYSLPQEPIEAKMTIITPEGHVIEYHLMPGVNKVLLKTGYESYHVIIEAAGFEPLELNMLAEKFRNSGKSNSLVFNLQGNITGILEIRPGPQEGKDAMITDLDPIKNFSNYEYFEASFLTEPILTVMRTRRSLIAFDPAILPEKSYITSVQFILTFETMIWDSIYESQLDDFMLWDDRLVFRQIVEPWNEYEVNWENQPLTISANEVLFQSILNRAVIYGYMTSPRSLSHLRK